MSYAPDRIVVSPHYVGPCRRTHLRARKREEQHLTTAMECGMLSLAHAPRRRLADGAHLADEVTLHWPRAYRAGSPAAALAATGSPAIAADLARWMLSADHGGAARLVPISVLVPDAAPRNAGLIDMAAAALDHSGLAPSRLELRFSEAALMDRSAEALLCLSSLRDFGVAIAMDDWGRRIGSLTVLRDLPLTSVRLDPALTHQISAGGEDEALAATLARLARRLGIQVVAQAVEDAGHRDRLCSLGVEAGTGRFTAPLSPCPAPPSAPAAP